MANIGVFNRNVSSPTSIDRSLQRLEHRHTFTTKYGQIVPNFSMVLMPHESIKINVTNFLRTIPMKVPMMSRVRIVQRFIAVPHRIMFLGFEDYINAVNDARFVYEEPYIANFNGIFKWYTTYTSAGYSDPVADGFDRSVTSIISTIQSRTPQATDFSIVGIVEAKGHVIQGRNGYAYSRAIFSELDTSKGWVVETLHTGTKETSLTGYQFFPHELGDYLNAPLWSVGLARDKTTHFSAYKFAAYQLAYSYFYRNANVQDRVDDIYEMAEKYSDQYFPEMPSFYGYLEDGKVTPPISRALDKLASDSSYETYLTNRPATWEIHNGSAYKPTDLTLQSDKMSVEATSWDRVEHFPLKSGPNLVMQGFSLDPATGAPILKDSRISLTRMRFANWYSDRFITANPWPQRGDEARIPVVGTATFDSLTVTVTPQGTVSSEFSSVGSNVTIPSSLIHGGMHGDFPVKVGLQTNDNGYGGPTTSLAESITENVGKLYGYIDGPAATAFATGQSLYTTEGSVHVPVDGAVTSTFTGSPSSVSLSSPTAVSGLYVSPSSFRFYMQLQKIKEMSARTDGRYKSFLSMFYGATERDGRLDRPEFIGGSVQDLNVTEVQQNTPGTSIETGVLGSLAGRGTSAKRSTTISFRTDEHCVILGLMHILPDNEYIGGLNREDNIQDAWDYPYPQFAGISEQPIRLSELSMQSSQFASADNDKNNEAFGYEPAYNWRRAKHSYVTGAFRDTFNNTGSREYYKPWIVTRNFGYEPSVIVNSDNGFVGMSLNTPTLSDAFLSTRHNVDYSNFEVTNPEVMYPFMCDSYFDVRYVTVLPKRGIPKL